MLLIQLKEDNVSLSLTFFAAGFSSIHLITSVSN